MMKKITIYVDEELCDDYAIAISGAMLYLDALSSNNKTRKIIEDVMGKAGLPIMGEVEKRKLIFEDLSLQWSAGNNEVANNFKKNIHKNTAKEIKKVKMGEKF